VIGSIASKSRLPSVAYPQFEPEARELAGVHHINPSARRRSSSGHRDRVVASQ